MGNKKLRVINTHFWDDPYIMNLDPIEKEVYFYLFTNSLCNLVGIYEIAIKRIAFDTGVDRDMVAKLLERFERDGKVKYVDGYIIMHNFMKNQNYNANMIKGAKRLFEQLPETIRNHSKGFETVAKYECECEVESEVEYEERSRTEKPLPSLAEVKMLFKEHNKEQEAEKFFNYYSLNNWTTKAGQPIKDLKAAVKNWIKRDITEAEKKEPTGERRSDYEISVSDEIAKITDADMLQLFANRTWAESAYKKLSKSAQQRITNAINFRRSYCIND